MKKIVLSLLVFTFSIVAFAQKDFQPSQRLKPLLLPNHDFGKTEMNQDLTQKAGGDIIWQNNFSVPQDWTIETNGQGTFIIGNNNHPEIAGATDGLSSYMGAMSTVGTTASNGFAFFNGVQYLINGAVDPQDTWVKSDTIDLSNYLLNYITISFNQRFRHLNYDSTFVEISENAGQTWVSYPLNEGYATNDPAVQNTILKLVPVSGSALTMIRFRWKSDSADDQFGSGYGWMIDDVKLIEPFLDEINISKVFTNDVINAFDYYSTPLTQASPMTYGAIVENLGSQSISKYIKFNVTLSSSVFLDSALVTILPGGLDTVWLSNAFTPTQLGTYSLNVYATDQGVLTNNSMTDEFKITDYIYGHNYPVTGSLTFGFNTVDATVGMGNIYQCFQNQQLNGLQVQFGTGTTSNTDITAEFYEVITSIQDPNNVYLTDGYYTTPSTINTSTPTDIAFDAPITLEAGKLYMVVLKFYQTSTNKIKFKASSKGNDDFSTVGYGPFGASAGINYFTGWSSAPHISLNFDPVLGTEEIEQVQQAVIMPNPSNGVASLQFELLNASDVTITVLDVAGKEVQNTVLNQLTSGTQNVALESAKWNSGVYFVNIASNGTVLTKKFVKK
jgi:hypothetical protein